MRMMSYGIEDKPRLAVAFPLAFQNVLSAFTGQIAVGMLLAMGFGLSVKETALLIQCALFITGIATIIQSFGIGKHIGARLPIVSGGSFTLITPMVVAANNPNIGIGGAFGAALVGSHRHPDGNGGGHHGACDGGIQPASHFGGIIQDHPRRRYHGNVCICL